MMKRLDGRTALVTGAASGIGRATAVTLAREGAAVLLTDIDVAGGEATVAAIVEAGGHAWFAQQDVVEEDRWAALVADCLARTGRLDVLVNNAGIGDSAPVTEMSLAAWDRQLAINVTGVFLGVKHAIPAMRRDKPAGTYRGGSIINISSVAGLAGSAGLSGYCATKGAVRLFSKAVAMECAQAKDGIRCNSVHPGIIDTPIWTKIDETGVLAEGLGIPGANAIDPAVIAMAAPLGFPGQPTDIADGILFLASDESRYITGSELVIDGGWTAH